MHLAGRKLMRRTLMAGPPRRSTVAFFLSAMVAILAAVAGSTPLAAFCDASLPAPATAMGLAEAVAVAMAANPAVRAARGQAGQAAARVNEAVAGTRITITFSSTVAGSNADVAQPPPSGETFASMQNAITLPIPIGSKPGLAVAQARAQDAAARAAYDGVCMDVTNEVIGAYFAVLADQAQLADAHLTLEQAQRQLDATRLRYNAQDVPDLDVIRAQAPVDEAQAGVLQAQSTLTVSEQTFNSVIGRAVDTVVSLQSPPDVLPDIDVTPDEAASRAVARSSDLAAALASEDAASAALKAARRWREPSLALQAIDARTGDVTSLSRQDTIQATVTAPLSDGGLATGQASEAQAALDTARAQADQARLTAETAAAADYENARAARLVAAAAKDALDVAQLASDKTALGYKNGLYSLTDVLSAQEDLAQQRNSYTRALFDAGTASALLSALIGETLPGGNK